MNLKLEIQYLKSETSSKSEIRMMSGGADILRNSGSELVSHFSFRGPPRPTAGFTLSEVLAFLLVIAVLLAVVSPRVITVMARDRVTGATQSLARLKTATAAYVAKHGSLPLREGTGSTDEASPEGRFDADLVADAFSEKLFHCPIGRQTVDKSPLKARIHVRCLDAISTGEVSPPTAITGGDNFNLDRNLATADFKTGQKIVAVFIPGVTLADAIELNKALDGESNSGTGPDNAGRCIYSAAASDKTTTVYIYVAHY